MGAGSDFATFGGYGGYVIDREVGRGGHATVYRAHHPSKPERAVALKVLDERHRTAAEQARLDREYEFARRLRHPHIVTMYERGPYWLAMQLVDGGKATRLQTLDERLSTLAQIADALDFAHRNGIVHSDVKPANILVDAGVRHTGAVLVDFGVAHAVVEDVGRRQKDPEVSLPYTAPEVLVGHAPSAASDEYALACTAVELLTGTPPFKAETAAELVDAHLRRIPPPISRDIDWLPRAFDTVLGRGMAKIPEKRYRTCTELIENLVRALRPGG